MENETYISSRIQCPYCKEFVTIGSLLEQPKDFVFCSKCEHLINIILTLNISNC